MKKKSEEKEIGIDSLTIGECMASAQFHMRLLEVASASGTGFDDKGFREHLVRGKEFLERAIEILDWP